MEIRLNLDQQSLPVAENNNAKDPVRLGIIGCGYVTKWSHLPASKMVAAVKVEALVDLRIDVAKELATAYDVPICTTDYQDLFGHVDAVIIALPHDMHTQVALDFLNRGIHVLVEKPMALTVQECEQMISAAHANKARLGVGLMRRFYDSNLLMKYLIDAQFLGKVNSFVAEEAVIFDNFKASPFTVLPPAGGVLYDTGSHVMDLLLWWFGDFKQVDYFDDIIQGVEANCRIEAVTQGNIPGVVELSRTRFLENKIRVICEKGSLEIHTLCPTQLFIESPLFSGKICASRMVENINQLEPYFARQLSDFAASIQNQRDPFVPGREGLRGIELIERCKRTRKPLEVMPWSSLNQEIVRRLSS